MSVRPVPAVTAIVVLAVTVATVVAATALYGFDLVPTAFGLWAVVGALIILLRPGNAVGWLFSGVGVLWVTGWLAAETAQEADGGPLLTVASWHSEWTWVAGFLCMTSSLLLIPTGSTTSRRWAFAFRLYGVAGLAVVTATWFQETLQAADDVPAVDNPIGITGVGDVGDAGAGPLLLFVGLGMGLVSLAVRFRRGDPDERRRLKLIALAAAVMVLLALAGVILEADSRLADLAWGVAAAVVPVACGIAILRHQLFDVDVVVSKALVYGALTLILGTSYLGLVLAGQAVFSAFAGGSDLAIAASTLVVAALFLPVRRRVQGFVDRRFYRRRYDSQRTLEAFGARLRDEVDLETLTGELRGVVGETIQPAHVSLWLRREVRS